MRDWSSHCILLQQVWASWVSTAAGFVVSFRSSFSSLCKNWSIYLFKNSSTWQLQSVQITDYISPFLARDWQFAEDLTIIDLIIKNWDIKRCIQIFLNLAWYILEDGLFSEVFDFAKRILRCTLLNSAYDATTIKNALKKIFGADQSMLSHSSNRNARKKILITVTKIGASKCIAFNNYNKSTRQHDE